MNVNFDFTRNFPSFLFHESLKIDDIPSLFSIISLGKDLMKSYMSSEDQSLRFILTALNVITEKLKRFTVPLLKSS